ncbi:zinc finger TRAF-type-containing protein 1 isoform X2 [Hippopotamus amphibius kiboko]|uniref:zinc finger TRAF-type-containing protein 1 isoform X2 n=1 Tax=Hippopotamus amphibius kiboko TaxID=575201 RepID=UPI002592BE13|nr:zinc finger TRAF-type-containing protein 1 isoform X2 [Hippopotamus amphibius kiboko]
MGRGAPPCPPWSLGSKGRLLDDCLLRAVVRVTLPATLDGDRDGGRACPVAWLASELGLLPGGSGQGRHGSHLRCLEMSGCRALCMSVVGAHCSQHVLAWAQPLHSCWPSLCTNGHLMCAGCFIHLLADARLKEEQATCPNCRCEISKSLCCRNLAVEKAVSELPSECGFCLCQFPRSLLERHQKEECQDRVTQCKYKRIGCPWHGPFHELTMHEAACAHPTKTGNELMEILDEMDQSHRKEMQLYNSIFSLLSFEKIGYTEVQFRPYRTDDFITRLYYETPRFTVLNQTWVLKARVNDSERNPNLSCKRTLSFQLLLKSKVTAPLECSFLLLKGPYDDVKISPVIYHFVFTNESNETDYVPLPIVDSVECNKLLAAKNINLRLFLFQIQK